jgi:hypothetical protein
MGMHGSLQDLIEAEATAYDLRLACDALAQQQRTLSEEATVARGTVEGWRRFGRDERARAFEQQAERLQASASEHAQARARLAAAARLVESQNVLGPAAAA